MLFQFYNSKNLYCGLLGTGLTTGRTYERGLQDAHRTRDGDSTHAKIFCYQAQNYYCKTVASITIDLFQNLNTLAVYYLYSDYYTNKPYKFRLGS